MKHMIAALPVARTLKRPSYLASTLPLAVSETASEWVVCYRELHDAANGMVACPLTSERVTVLEHCLACRHLTHLSNERTRMASCAAGESYS